MQLNKSLSSRIAPQPRWSNVLSVTWFALIPVLVAIALLFGPPAVFAQVIEVPEGVSPRVLNDNDVVRLGSKLFRALCQVRNAIGADRELRLLEFLQAGIDRVRVAMYKKGANRAASVGRRALRTHSYMIRVDFALSQT